jgi:Zn-finger nucleic acid-binding protein
MPADVYNILDFYRGLNDRAALTAWGTLLMNDETLRFLDELEGGLPPAGSNDALVEAGERPCPICGDTMEVTLDYGVHLDFCEDHGIWLDAGEMPRMLSRIRAGERVSSKSAVRKARREGKMSGTLFGVWSLMFD